MRRLLVIVALAAALVATAAPAAQARPGCDDGATVFAEGRLRILATFFDTPDETGNNHWACFGGKGRPVLVGGFATTPGLASGDTPAYAFGGGGRYVGALNVSDGEGGPDSDITVTDVRARRTVAFLNLACCEGTPPFRVGADGTVVVLTPDVGLFVKRPGRATRLLADEGARDLAMAGGTVYWSEGGQPRATVLDGLATHGGLPEARMLEPVRARKRARGPCPGARGRTVTASSSVRVVQRAGGARRFACRAGTERRVDAGRAGAATPRIVADRWLLVFRHGALAVIDTRTGETVTNVDTAASHTTLLRDGTLAWIDHGGGVHVRRPGDATPVELAPIGTPSTALAASRRTIYWTVGGEPRSYRPPSVARSASKPG